MKDVTLVVLAAGMGSRYGGLKQIDPIGPNGEIILEMSAFDAIRAGFNKIVFIIKKAIEEDFKKAIGNKIAEHIKVEYVFQEMDACLPEGYEIPADRVKPWGTAHAILCCKNVIHEPFAVTDHGSVARGVCKVEDGKLAGVDERTRIEKREGRVQYYENDTWYDVDANSLVSMNMWGFTPKFMEEVEERFPTFLQETVKENPLKSEFYIPVTVDTLIREGKATVTVLSSDDKWYGVTYQEDKPMVKEGIRKLIEAGKYPVPLWSK